MSTTTDQQPIPAHTASGSPVIRATGLTRSFGGVLAVDKVDLEVPRGSVTGILGPNGSGKSTFLRMLIGLVRPDSGSARVAGVELVGDGTAIRRVSTFAPGEIALYGEMRGGEQLDWLLRGREHAALGAARALCERLGLPLEKKVHEYSHGMKRQLLFAAAMGPLASVRILDEPTEGLDPAKRREVLEIIREERERGGTVLLSSHHLSEVEAVCERLVFFHTGRILADETPADLRARARRSVSIEFADAADASALVAALRGAPGIGTATADGTRVQLELERDDPRPFLASLEALGGPAPTSIEVGRLSLTDLYRTVYGVSGL